MQSQPSHEKLLKVDNGRGFPISPERIDAMDADTLQKFGITFKKAEYIKKAARKVIDGELQNEQGRNV